MIRLKTIATFASIIAAWPTLSAASGRTVGNGGDVVVCRDAQLNVSSIELLDFFEGRELKQNHLQLGPASLSVSEKIDLALTKLERVSAHRAARYRQHAQTFLSETLFLKSGYLGDINDSGSIAIPTGCKIEQIANQSAPLFPDDKRYVVDDSLWQLLDHDSQAGLILHEVIYREALELGHINSVSTRMLNSILTSQRIEMLSVAQFTQILADLGFTTNSVQGALLSLVDIKRDTPTPPEFYPNGRLKSANVVEGSDFIWQGQRYRVRDQIAFYASGQIQALVLAVSQDLLVFGAVRKIGPYELSFSERGDILEVTFDSATDLRHPFYKVSIEGAAEFFQNGVLRLANVLKGEVHLGGTLATIVGVSKFHETGRLQMGTLLSPTSIGTPGNAHRWQGLVELTAEERVVRGTLANPSSFAIGSRMVELSPFRQITFFSESGAVKSGCLHHAAVFESVGGGLTRFAERTILEWNEKGAVVAQHGSC